MEREGNSESSPEIRWDHSGRLVQQGTTYRGNNRYQGHFYLCNKEMGLVDSTKQVSVQIVIATGPKLGRAWRYASS
jgi:cytoskeletal protein CcmA (bactofilin family)